MSFFIQTSRRFSKTASLMIKQLSRRANPGLGHQITTIEDAAEAIQSDPEGFGDIESDLMDAHRSHKQYELEVRKQRDKIRQHIVQRKYFRKQQSLPNFLTYAEKEQIRFLHSSDNNEWTIEKLAECFPANVEIILKVLKSHWTPMSEKRILSHDASVFKNWERFKKGEYDKMNTELQIHLQKFGHRSLENLKLLQDPTKALPKKQWQKPRSSEFSSLLTLQSQREQLGASSALTKDEKSKSKNQQESDDTYILGKIENRQPITIKKLKNRLKQIDSNSETKTLANEEKLKISNIDYTGIVENNLESAKIRALDYTEKFIATEIVIDENDRKKYGMSPIKE